jgi:hypothetical protein
MNAFGHHSELSATAFSLQLHHPRRKVDLFTLFGYNECNQNSIPPLVEYHEYIQWELQHGNARRLERLQRPLYLSK